jgi:hypothetical protein
MYKKVDKSIYYKKLFQGSILIIFICLVITTLTLADEIPGIIYSKERTEEFASKLPVAGELTPPFWTPRIEEVRALEKLLPEFIRKNIPQNRKPIGTISKYKRQYLGITRNGKRQIYVNAFCEQHWSQKKDWESRFVFVLGGGNCYFRILFDPATNEFTDFVINSER